MKKRSQSVNVKHRKISFGDFQTETIGISVKKILIEVPYIISPVRGKYGKFFDSRKATSEQPQDADANGAYNIARKGQWLVEKIRRGEDAKMTAKDWLQFVQRN